MEELKTDFLKPRKYKDKVIKQQFDRIKALPGNSYEEKRNFALKKVDKTDKNADRVIMPIDYNPHMPIASTLLQKHHKTMLFSNPALKAMFSEPPMPALRQPKNIRKILCRSKLYPVTRSRKLRRQTHKDAPGWKECNNPCKACTYTLDKCTQLTGLASGYTPEITEPLSCATTN